MRTAAVLGVPSGGCAGGCAGGCEAFGVAMILPVAGVVPRYGSTSGDGVPDVSVNAASSRSRFSRALSSQAAAP